jgi:hypothetical protein
MLVWHAVVAAFAIFVFGAIFFGAVVLYVPGVWQWLERQRRD